MQILLVGLLIALLAPANDSRSGKKLIEWGWDQPTTAALRENITKMEQTPFDGVVLTVVGSEDGKPIDFQWQTWGRRGFTRGQFAAAVADLRATRFRRF